MPLDPAPWDMQAAPQVDAPVLCLGIGAQKAGTSWLHAWLSRHSAVVAGPMKELHYFSRTGADRQAAARARWNADPTRRTWVERLITICDAPPDPQHRAYCDLMMGGLARGQVALDITPAYAVLPAPVVAEMAAIPQARAIYILRDPVARMWSAARMLAARSAPQDLECAARAQLDAWLAGAGQGAFDRTDYAATLARYGAAFGPDRLLVLFFETLFTQGAADRITRFLGLTPQPVGLVGPRNPGPPAQMRPDQARRLVEMLAGQYAAVSARWPDLPMAWRRSLGGLA